TARQQIFPCRLYHCWCLALLLSYKINAETFLRDPQGAPARVKVGTINAWDKRAEARTDDAAPPRPRGLSRRRFWGSGPARADPPTSVSAPTALIGEIPERDRGFESGFLRR